MVGQSNQITTSNLNPSIKTLINRDVLHSYTALHSPAVKSSSQQCSTPLFPITTTRWRWRCLVYSTASASWLYTPEARSFTDKQEQCGFIYSVNQLLREKLGNINFTALFFFMTKNFGTYHEKGLTADCTLKRKVHKLWSL